MRSRSVRVLRFLIFVATIASGSGAIGYHIASLETERVAQSAVVVLKHNVTQFQEDAELITEQDDMIKLLQDKCNSF